LDRCEQRIRWRSRRTALLPTPEFGGVSGLYVIRAMFGYCCSHHLAHYLTLIPQTPHTCCPEDYLPTLDNDALLHMAILMPSISLSLSGVAEITWCQLVVHANRTGFELVHPHHLPKAGIVMSDVAISNMTWSFTTQIKMLSIIHEI